MRSPLYLPLRPRLLALMLGTASLLHAGATLAGNHLCQKLTQDEYDAYLTLFPEYDPSFYEHFTVTFPAGPIEVSPDLPLGSVITTGTTPGFILKTVLTCHPSGTVYWRLLSASVPSSLPDIYKTDVPGVGYRVNYVRPSGKISPVPFVHYMDPPISEDTPMVVNLTIGATVQIDLVKTGDMPSHSIVHLGPLAAMMGDDNIEVVHVDSGSATLRVLPDCHVDNPNQNVNFGPFGPTDVTTTTGPTRAIDFSVLCTKPTPASSITATLSATPDQEDSTLIQNTGAKHLAIRLQDISGSGKTILKPNDPNSTVVTRPGGNFQSDFRLEATVLRVGSATPTGGKIDATATLTLTIE